MPPKLWCESSPSMTFNNHFHITYRRHLHLTAKEAAMIYLSIVLPVVTYGSVIDLNNADIQKTSNVIGKMCSENIICNPKCDHDLSL